MAKSSLISAPHPRIPWGHPGDETVIVHGHLGKMNGTWSYRKEELAIGEAQRALYAKAKQQNDMDAATKIVLGMIDAGKIGDIISLVERCAVPPIIVCPHPSFNDEACDGANAVEQGHVTNALPFAFAAYLAEVTGAEISDEIVQSARVGRTQLSLFPRFLWQPKFEGAVKPRYPYILADDVLTNGGTFAALRCHILESGGTLLCCTALAHKTGQDQKFAIAAHTLGMLENVFGDKLPTFWKDTIGHEIYCLTDSEASRLLEWSESSCQGAAGHAERLHILRERIAKAAAKGE